MKDLYKVAGIYMHKIKHV